MSEPKMLFVGDLIRYPKANYNCKVLSIRKERGSSTTYGLNGVHICMLTDHIIITASELGTCDLYDVPGTEVVKVEH